MKLPTRPPFTERDYYLMRWVQCAHLATHCQNRANARRAGKIARRWWEDYVAEAWRCDDYRAFGRTPPNEALPHTVLKQRFAALTGKAAG